MFTKIIIYIAILLIFFIININSSKNEYKEHYENTNYIPKIIHQTAPQDKTNWKPEWFECQKSWFKYFPSPEYEYIMWTDEDLDNLIKNDFPWFYPFYTSYLYNIRKIDIARYFILYKYGGIYADMDYMCMKNFYDLLPQDKISISESPYKHNEYIQNALMISNKLNNFWMYVVEEAKNRINVENTLSSTGPQLLSDIYFQHMNDVYILNEKEYNPDKNTSDFFNENIITKHFGTESWS
jgi:mannosyltransferase OCH1-like enzyme